MGGEDGILCLGVDPVGAGLCVTVSHKKISLTKNAYIRTRIFWLK